MTDGVRIFGHVDHCVLGLSVVVEEGAYIKDSVLMPGSYVKTGAKKNVLLWDWKLSLVKMLKLIRNSMALIILISMTIAVLELR